MGSAASDSPGAGSPSSTGSQTADAGRREEEGGGGNTLTMTMLYHSSSMCIKYITKKTKHFMAK